MVEAAFMCSNNTRTLWVSCREGKTDYGLNQSSPSETAGTVFASLTLGIITVLSISGNMMVLYVIAKHLKFRTVTNTFIATLSVSDLCTAIICMPMALTTVISKDWLFGDAGCIANETMVSTFGIVSTIMLTFITADRYFVVVKLPKKPLALFPAIIAICVAWCFALLISSPWYLLQGDKLLNCSQDSCDKNLYRHGYQHCMYFFHIANSRYKGVAFNILYICICYMVPTVAMSFSSYSLWKIIHHNDRQIRPSTTPVTQLRFNGEMRTAKTVVIMVLLFLVTRWPYLISALIAAMIGGSPSSALDTAGLWLFWTNCALNPVVYALRNPTVAKILRIDRKSGYEDCTAPQCGATIRDCNLPNTSSAEWLTPRQAKYLPESQNNTKTEVNGRGSRSDSIPSILTFKARNARKGSSFSTLTTSTSTTTYM